ncbi:hypothetical protein A2574_01265 [Candidatus Shapirobacteria bacterium RIFOXYD1_FULL_38_32]|nr:MAG: hypothetical protein A2574_01265 [Candidatus Shapirobacteria bacterium RIFOXYD1_FULL_38_32]HCU54926.1 hypothetical protein [Candidatus Shapirobacteria bacterium]
MSDIKLIGLLSLSAFISYLVSVTPLINFTPQLIALLTIIIIFSYRRHPLLFLNHISYIINLLIFTTSGVNSPFFFLNYFFLFLLTFQSSPTITLSYSLILTILLSQSLNSPLSLLPLLSLLFVAPLAYYISRQFMEKSHTDRQISMTQTEVFLWLSLKFKTGITTIIDSASLLLSNPSLSPPQKDQLKKIKSSARNLLNSSYDLTDDVQDNEIDNEI